MASFGDLFDNPITGAVTGGLLGGGLGATVGGVVGASNLDFGSNRQGQLQQAIRPFSEFVEGRESTKGDLNDTDRQQLSSLQAQLSAGEITADEYRQQAEALVAGASTPGVGERISGITEGLAETTQPFAEAGVQAVERLSGLLSGEISIFDDPAFQAMLGGATRNVQASAAAGGGLLSGGTLIDLQTRGQELGGQFLQQQAGMLSGLAGMGLTAADVQAQRGLSGIGLEGQLQSELAQAQSALVLGQQRTDAAEDAAQLALVGDVLGLGTSLIGAG